MDLLVLKFSQTALDLFHLLKEFEKLHNVKEEMTINLVDDQLQENGKQYLWTFSIAFLRKLIPAFVKQ